MKKTLLFILCLLITSAYVIGQDINEDLYKAISNNDKTKTIQLLNDGADANYIKASGPWMKVNMLITAVNQKDIDIVKALIDHKADVNWKDGFNTSAAMYAASSGNKEILTLLLEKGADINASDGQGNSVLSAAKESKNKDLVKYVQAKLKSKN